MSVLNMLTVFKKLMNIYLLLTHTHTLARTLSYLYSKTHLNTSVIHIVSERTFPNLIASQQAVVNYAAIKYILT